MSFLKTVSKPIFQYTSEFNVKSTLLASSLPSTVTLKETSSNIPSRKFIFLLSRIFGVGTFSHRLKNIPTAFTFSTRMFSSSENTSLTFVFTKVKFDTSFVHIFCPFFFKRTPFLSFETFFITVQFIPTILKVIQSTSINFTFFVIFLIHKMKIGKIKNKEV